MKDSGVAWIGEIPDGWAIKNLPELFRERRVKNKNLLEKNLLSLSYGKIVKRDIQSNEGLLPESYEGYNIVEPDNIVLRLTDLQNDHRSLRTGLCRERGIITSAYLTIEPCSSLCAPYMHYLLHCYDECKVFYAMGDGVRQTIKYVDFKKLPLLFPPMNIQRRIASFLDQQCKAIDSLITGHQEIIEKDKEYKLSLITEAVTHGLNPGVETKDSGIDWIGFVPTHWQIGQLKYYASIRSGLTLGKKYPPESKLITMPYLRVANVQGEYIDLNDVATVEIPEQEIPQYLLHKGELLMTEGGDRDKLGRGCVWDAQIEPCLHQNHVFAVSTNKAKLDERFLDYMTTSSVARNYFDYTAKKTTNLASTNSTTIMQFKLPVPPINEQQEIVAFLDQQCSGINKSIDNRMAMIAKLTEYKKSLIYEVVTGKKEVG